MAVVIAANSALPIIGNTMMVFVTPIPFGPMKLGIKVAGWYVPALSLVFPLSIWQLLSVHAHSFQSRTFLAKCGLDYVGKSYS